MIHLGLILDMHDNKTKRGKKNREQGISLDRINVTIYLRRCGDECSLFGITKF